MTTIWPNVRYSNRFLREKTTTVFIDEVQRIPSILNTIQSIVDLNSKIKFYLTGSSARKLRRGSANLLLGMYLESDSKEALKTLRSYSGTYIKEEIQAESLTKNLKVSASIKKFYYSLF